MINSRDKGARAERLWRDELIKAGYTARRGQQFCGSPESPDVICKDLDWLHQEVKAVERLNLDSACQQAQADSNGKPWIVAHKKNRRGWHITMPADLFFYLLLARRA